MFSVEFSLREVSECITWHVLRPQILLHNVPFENSHPGESVLVSHSRSLVLLVSCYHPKGLITRASNVCVHNWCVQVMCITFCIRNALMECQFIGSNCNRCLYFNILKNEIKAKDWFDLHVWYSILFHTICDGPLSGLSHSSREGLSNYKIL
jgi:hypothetical protein